MPHSIMRHPVRVKGGAVAQLSYDWPYARTRLPLTVKQKSEILNCRARKEQLL